MRRSAVFRCGSFGRLRTVCGTDLKPIELNSVSWHFRFSLAVCSSPAPPALPSRTPPGGGGAGSEERGRDFVSGGSHRFFSIFCGVEIRKKPFESWLLTAAIPPTAALLFMGSLFLCRELL